MTHASDPLLRSDPLGRLVARCKVTPLAAFSAAFILLGVVEQAIVPHLAHYPPILEALAQGGSARYARIYALLNGFFFTPIGWGYYVWSTQSPRQVYSALISNGLIAPRARRDFNAAFARLVGRLGSTWLMILTFSLATVFVYFMARGWAHNVPVWFGHANYVHRYFAIATSWLADYMLFWILVREAGIALWIRYFARLFKNDVHVQPGHPDGAGGFGRVGLHALRLNLFIVNIGLALATSRLITLSSRAYTTPYGWAQLTGMVIYLVFTPLLAYWFIRPIRRLMARSRTRTLLSVSLAFRAEGSPRLGLFSLAGPTLSAKARRLENLASIHSIYLDLVPVWPFRRPSRAFALVSVIPLMSLLLGAYSAFR